MKTLKRLHSRLLFVAVFLSMTFIMAGQSVVAILEKEPALLKPENQDLTTECYQVKLLNNSGKTIGLAGQNYRMYYDSDAALLDEKSIVSYLSNAYTPLKLVQHTHDADASGYGNLPFEQHLGFINLAVDYKLSSAARADIGAGEKINVGRLCFNRVADKDIQLTWAKQGITETYATAFVEIAQMDGKKLKKLNIEDLIVINETTTSVESVHSELGSLDYYPNPFNDQLVIKFSSALTAQTQLEVIDILGRSLYSEDISKGTESVSIKGQGLPEGTLMIKLKQQNKEVAVFKVVKTKLN